MEKKIPGNCFPEFFDNELLKTVGIAIWPMTLIICQIKVLPIGRP